MNTLSYRTIEQIINEANTRDFDTMVSVPVDTLRDLFKTVRRGLRAQGILGFNDDGYPIVNDIGMVAIIQSVAKDEYESMGTMVSCDVSRKSPDLMWNAKMVFAAPNGTHVTITQSYELRYLNEVRRFEYKLP